MVKASVKFICTQRSQSGKNQGRWSSEEQDRFLKGCYLYKNNWKKIQEYIKTRTIPQIRSHAQKYLIRLCGKYSIKLSKKKFALSTSNKDIATVPCKKRLNISKMDIYEKNIFEMFNYYNREIINEDSENQEQNTKENKNNNISNNNPMDFINNNVNINPEINSNEKITNNKDRLINDLINFLLLKQKNQLEGNKISNNFPFDNLNLCNNYDIIKKHNLELFNNNFITNNPINYLHNFNNPKFFSNEINNNNFNYNIYNNINYFNRNVNNNITNNLLINKSLDFKNLANYTNKTNENLNQIYKNNCMHNQYNIIPPSISNQFEINDYDYSRMHNLLNDINNKESQIFSIQPNQFNNYQNYNNNISFYDYANNYSNYAASQIFNYTLLFFNKLKEQSIIQLNKLEDLNNQFSNKN